MATVDTSTLWAKWMGEIANIALPQGIGAGQRLHAASTSLAIDLGNADTQIGSEYVFELGDTIPHQQPQLRPGHQRPVRGVLQLPPICPAPGERGSEPRLADQSRGGQPPLGIHGVQRDRGLPSPRS